MNRLYILIAVTLFSVSFTSCTAEDISETTNQYANDDTGGETGGQTGTINPPPPPVPVIPIP
ncbi:hypothetical protein SY27_03980 [Flavobacterium sp. 316]|uniref:hypothetical protein n=1 Tax=Flavobacterium sp. 316 TaxID=1603293 RepID=UPI0005E50B9D|nr:hypothetical protein [Flavobacterium sp. 316]KIX21853.1 hypothetical protein SY27_03980 [Flavobacterium sp. 316]